MLLHRYTALCLLIFSPLASAQTHVRITGDQFTWNGQVYRIKGCNYYPQNHMWEKMWNEWDWPEITGEIALLKNYGVNAVRILVPYSKGGWNGPLVPSSRLQMLEDVVNQFGASGIRSCITLFDWETSFPAAGTATESNHITYLNTIVQRMKNNPYVLCWDVKNEPDHPSNISGYDNWDSSPGDRDRIVSWLNRMCNAVRARDTLHGVSAGIRWWQNVQDVIAFEDIAMFHSYWPNIGQEITDVKSYMPVQKPILVEEFGWPTSPSPNYTESLQLSFYQNHLTAFASNNIAGGIMWMAFDALNYGSSSSYENYFGLWKYGYAPLKPGGVYYRDNFTVSRFPAEPDTVPPGPVSGLTALARTASISLNWTNPADTDFAGVTIRYGTTAYPATVQDGQLLANVAGTPGVAGGCTQSPFLYHTTYYYSVFARDTFNNYSAPRTVSLTTRTVGDFDADNDIDMGDFSHLQACLSGSSVPQTLPACQDCDFDGDGDVDYADLALLLRCLMGANTIVPADCGMH